MFLFPVTALKVVQSSTNESVSCWAEWEHLLSKAKLSAIKGGHHMDG